ncbi:hypothetical protein VPH35_038053 [Triticum aestivum]
MTVPGAPANFRMEDSTRFLGFRYVWAAGALHTHKSDPSAHTAQPTCDSLASGYPWFLRPTPSTPGSPFLSHSQAPILLLPLGVCLWANLSGNGDLSSPARPSSDVATPSSIATRSTTAPSSSPVSADLRRRPALPTVLPSHAEVPS